MIKNSFFIERKRMPLTKDGVYSDTDYLLGSLGYRLFAALDFIGILEENGTTTFAKNKFNGKKHLTAEEFDSIIRDYSVALDKIYDTDTRAHREKEERKAKEESAAFAAREFKPSNPPRRPKADKPAKSGNKARKR